MQQHKRRCQFTAKELPVMLYLRFTGLRQAVAYAENFHGGGFIQWHMAVICICCALFVTSQFDIIFMFPN